jgi:membrane complex biogenesis BtpA family protein
MNFKELFSSKKPIIACIHLLPLPGSPRYRGSMKEVYDMSVKDAEIFRMYNVDGLIVENFRDNPFYPDRLPSESIAAMSAVTREVKKVFSGPIGINALRNDALSALSIAAAAEVHFIRVNVHIGAAVTDQGIIEGKAHETLRLRKILDDRILIFADVAVKHASILGKRTIIDETKDLSVRGMADALIVTGDQTGGAANPDDMNKVKENTTLPVLIGSGITDQNIKEYFGVADGFIVGSFFKKDGIADNSVEENRVKKLMATFRLLKQPNGF